MTAVCHAVTIVVSTASTESPLQLENKLPSIEDIGQTDHVTTNATDDSPLLTATHSLKLTHQGQHQPGAESAIQDLP